MKLLLAIFLFVMSAVVLAAVNINTATQQELETLKGVGPAKARAIIKYREQHGPFILVQDLRRVPGFGEKSVRKLEKDVVVSGPSVMTPRQ